MMCPSCQFENSDELESCVRCGATLGPAEDGYGTEAWHCTSCGARAVAEVSYCQQCGEATTLAAEWVVGACVNCGGAWHKSWQFCRTCGVARANALLDESVALPVYFAEYAPPTLARPSPGGKPRGDLSVCVQCGAELSAEVNYCNQCGARVGPAPAADNEGPAPQAAREAPHSRRAPDDDSISPAALALEPPPDQTPPQPRSRAAEPAAGDGARPPTSRPVGYRRAKQRARRWRMAAAIFLIIVILLFSFLIASETQLQDVLQKLRALVPGLGFAR